MNEQSHFNPKTAEQGAVLDAGAANDALAAGPQACDGMAVPQPGAAAAPQTISGNMTEI